MKSEGNRLLCLDILDLLRQYASKEKPMLQKELLQRLEDDLDIRVTRKTLAGYINEMADNGLINPDTRHGLYRIGEFSTSELRLLIDGVLFAPYVPAEKGEKLINKLKKLSNGDSLKNCTKNVYQIKNLVHTRNKNLYEVLDCINEAITRNCRIMINRVCYDEKGQPCEKKMQEVSPYYLVTSNSRYYLICFAGRFGDLENRRVDRITKVKILDTPAVDKNFLHRYRRNRDFSLDTYMKEHIYMFSGETADVVLKIKADHLDDFEDWYGYEYGKPKVEDGYAYVHIKVNENAVYYWALQYGGIVEIVRPVALRRRMAEGLTLMLEKYNHKYNLQPMKFL